MSKLIAFVCSAALVALTAGQAAAQAPATQPSQPAVAASADASAEVKAAKGVEKGEPVEEGTTFEAGTTVWAWSKVLNAPGTVKHVWKKDGKAVWTANLRIGSKKWVTHSRRKLTKPGSYAVDVVGADDAVLGTVSFTVQ